MNWSVEFLMPAACGVAFFFVMTVSIAEGDGELERTSMHSSDSAVREPNEQCAEPALSERAAIEGTWELESRRNSGGEIDSARGEWQTFSRNSVNRFGFHDEGLIYEIDSNASPKTIDVVIKNSELEPIRSKGIYKLEADTLTICFGRDQARPSQFLSTRKNRYSLEVWKRLDSESVQSRLEQIEAEKDRLIGTWKVYTRVASRSSSLLLDGVHSQHYVFADSSLNMSHKSSHGDNYTANYTIHILPSGTKEIVQRAAETNAVLKVQLLLADRTFFRWDKDDLEILVSSSEPKSDDWAKEGGEYRRLRRIPKEELAARAAEFKRLAGRWRIEGAHFSGEAIDPGLGLLGEVGQYYVINAAEISLVGSEGTYEKSWSYEIDTNPSPRQVFFEFAGEFEGIYEIDGAQMRMCLSQPDKAGPAEFVTKEGDLQTLLRLRKVMDNE